VKITGLPTLAAFSFDHPDGKKLSTLFTQEMLSRGILGFRQFKSSWAHRQTHLEQYKNAVQEVFALIADVTKTGTLSRALKTSVAHDGFFRLTKE
jgi:hypothetical protein